MKISPRSIAVIFILMVIIIYAYSTIENETKAVDEKFCKDDADCACGMHIETGDCFYGNKMYVDIVGQCPDFCSGIDGKLKLRCINNMCKQIS